MKINRLSTIVVLIVLSICSSTRAFADAASANRQTPINNITDYFSTLGQDPKEKRETIRQRKKMRRDARVTQEAQKKKKLMKAKMKAQRELIMRKVRTDGN